MENSRSERIKSLLQSLQPERLVLVDESHKHALHAEHIGLAKDGVLIETHFKLTLVSKVFEGKSRIERAQMVHELLKDEFKSGLHALTQTLKTPGELPQA